MNNRLTPRHSTPESESTLPTPNETENNSERELTKGAVLAGLLALGLTVGISHAIKSERGGSDTPEQFGKPNPYISAVVIEDGARLRYDPVVTKDSNGGSNLIETAEDTIKVMAADSIYTTNNETGTWYGMPATDIPDFDAKGDKDGIVWVNEQKASAEYTDQ